MRLWTVVNERDELGPNLVPDYMTSVQEGAFYVWPWSYYGNHEDKRVHPPRPDMVEQAIAPDYALSSHVAALGLIFSHGPALPNAYQNGAFIGEHGSWNRNFFDGCKVVYVPFEDGRPAGKAQDVVTGFIDGDQAHGRPVGIAIDGTGALLIADDAGNTVWRVAAPDGSVTREPIGTDRVAAGPAPVGEAAGGGMPSDAVGGQGSAGQNSSASPSRGETPPEPSQTEIAPAVSPGAVQEGGAQQDH
ncbi:hypothetical protein [Dongia deserti]